MARKKFKTYDVVHTIPLERDMMATQYLRHGSVLLTKTTGVGLYHPKDSMDFFMLYYPNAREPIAIAINTPGSVPGFDGVGYWDNRFSQVDFRDCLDKTVEEYTGQPETGFMTYRINFVGQHMFELLGQNSMPQYSGKADVERLVKEMEKKYPILKP